MRTLYKNNGSAMLVTVFAVALMAVLTIGILQVTAEDTEIMRNQIYAAQALATAEAGLNDAFAQLRSDPNWTSGFTNKTFLSDSYTVTVTSALPSLTIQSTGTTVQGFVGRMSADVTLGADAPYAVRVDKLRINE